ncbi:MAG TPA: zinc dependent phospholipase C family protein [Gemmatimonadaceae bacterium]|nr:zinc dependent phospholipase C family protein [Gemmatimonadaceae bacterium]
MSRGAAIGVAALTAVVVISLTPHTAWAWTPGTHVFLSDAILRNLSLLPAGVAALLRKHPLDFIYGSIAADTSIAKKYAPEGRHCHSWRVGLEIRDRATDDALRTFGLGYLSHLAADSVAHNFFVPLQLARTATTSSIGHSYWESRFETHLPDDPARRARDIILLDHSRADAHLDQILSPTLFSTGTNRRIFRGMVRAADNDSWQRVFNLMLQRSRWDLEDSDVASHLARSFDYIVDFLTRDNRSEACRLDPSGAHALRDAKIVRRSALHGGSGAIGANLSALRAFKLPETSLSYARTLATPLYVRTRDASN